MFVILKTVNSSTQFEKLNTPALDRFEPPTYARQDAKKRENATSKFSTLHPEFIIVYTVYSKTVTVISMLQFGKMGTPSFHRFRHQTPT